MRRLRRLFLLPVVVATVVLWPLAAQAHPLGNFTVNHYAGITVVPGEIRIDYVVDMAEDPTYQVKFDIDVNGDKTYAPQEFSAWAAGLAPHLASGLTLAVDGRAVELTVTCSSAYFRPGQTEETPITRFEATFVGAAPQTGRLSFADWNYADRIGWREVTAVGATGVGLVGSDVPRSSVSDTLLSYPQDLLSSPLDVTTASLSYRTQPGAVAGPAPATCSRAGVAGGRPLVADSGFAKLIDQNGLPLMSLALVLAIGFGAWHALLPGHGKTLMAAYMVGSGSRVRQAVAIGVAVALMHTSSVLALGMLVLTLERTFRPDLLYPWLGLASGLVAIGLGTTLLLTRLGAWAELRRPAHGHAAEHAHGHAAEHAHGHAAEHARGYAAEHAHGHGPGQHMHSLPEAPVLSRNGLMALAVAGGILPAPAALIVMLAAIEAHRVVFGLGLIGAFSAGLAGALIVVGAATYRARERMARRLTSLWGRLIPVLSAGAIVGVGLFLAVRGATQVRL